MRKITYTLAAVAALAFSFSSCIRQDNDNISAAPQKVKVGALLSLTGNWSTLGLTSQAAIDIALEDINAYMTENGSKYQFSSIVYDTKLDAALATQYIGEANTAGCQFVVGPQSSAEAGAVKDYANTHNMMVVSQGSTAGSLSIDGDNLFRFCPDDHIEGNAMAKTIHRDGISTIVTAARDDAGNKGLQTSTGNAFTGLGGMVSATSPYSPALSDFSPVLNEIRTRIIDAVTSGTAVNHVAVYLASFDECVPMFQQASGDPVLSAVRWYGGDGTALSTAITGNAGAADFAIATKYFAPSFGLPEEAAAKWEPLMAKIEARTGITPDAFALAAYDAMWVMAMTYASFPYMQPEFAKLKSEFATQAGMYYGATGSTLLNSAGDRSIGSYDYWGIAMDGTGYKWVLVGKSK
jgi:branched-chain amino acid transport system substrate-binding protein